MGWWADADVGSDGRVAVIVCGSRTWRDCTTVSFQLERLRCHAPLLTVIEGGEPNGADHCAAQWASDHRVKGVHWHHVPARWADLPSWKAGPERNATMRDILLSYQTHGQAVMVLAFKRKLDQLLFSETPTKASGGTEDMIRQSWGAAIPTFWCQDSHTAPGPVRPAASLFD